MKQVGGVYGYTSTQAATLATLSRQFPGEANRFGTLKQIFDLKFGHPNARAEAVLRFAMGTQFDNFSRTYIAPLSKKIENSAYSSEAASQFAAEMLQRNNGKLDQEVLSTMLWLEYASHPGREMADGWTQDYSSAGDPKALGLRLKLTLPRSWAGRPGHRPHILQFWTDQNGTGLRMVSILVKDVSAFGEITPEESGALLQKLNRELAPDRAKIESFKMIKLETLPFAKIVYTLPVTRNETTSIMFTQSYIGFFRGRMIMLQCMTATNSRNGPDSNTLKSGLVELCPAVANSMVIENRWD